MGNKKEDPIPVEEDEVYEVEALVGHRRSAHNKVTTHKKIDGKKRH